MTDSFPNNGLSPSALSSPYPNGVILPLNNDIPHNSTHHDDTSPPSPSLDLQNNTSKPRIYCLNTRSTSPGISTWVTDLVEHRPSRPSASQDLVSLYSLTLLANAVARFDPTTGKKNTMRKSYQGHIKDLPGKNVIKPDSIIREILRVPESEADTFVGPRNIRRLERDTLEGFGVMPGVIPDVCHPYSLRWWGVCVDGV